MNKKRRSCKRKKSRNRKRSIKLRSMKKFGISKTKTELLPPMEYEKPSDDDLKISLEPYKDIIGKKNMNTIIENSWITEKIIDTVIPSTNFNYDDLNFKKKLIIKTLRSGIGDYYRRLIAHKIYYDKDWIEKVIVKNIR